MMIRSKSVEEAFYLSATLSGIFKETGVCENMKPILINLEKCERKRKYATYKKIQMIPILGLLWDTNSNVLHFDASVFFFF